MSDRRATRATSTSPQPPSAAPSARPARSVLGRFAAALVAAAGVLHLILVPEYLAEEPFLGVLFLLAGPLTGWVAWRLWRGEDLPAWLLGVAVSVGMIVGFLVSRTVGLFGYVSADWAEGIPSLVVEAAFLALAAVRLPVILARRAAPQSADGGKSTRP